MVEGKLLPHTVLLNLESVNHLGELGFGKSFTEIIDFGLSGLLSLLIWISTDKIDLAGI